MFRTGIQQAVLWQRSTGMFDCTITSASPECGGPRPQQVSATREIRVISMHSEPMSIAAGEDARTPGTGTFKIHWFATNKTEPARRGQCIAERVPLAVRSRYRTFVHPRQEACKGCRRRGNETLIFSKTQACQNRRR